MLNLKCFLILSVIISGGWCLKILGVFTYHSVSHATSYKPLLEKLRENGHSLKLIAFFSLKQEDPGDVKLGSSQMAQRSYNFSQLESSNSDRVTFLHLNVSVKMCDKFLSSKPYMDLVQSDESYDVFLTEYFTTSCYITPLVQKFRVPFVILQTSRVAPWTGPWVNIPDNPSYIPINFFNLAQKTTFWERFVNAATWAQTYFYYYTVIASRDDGFLSACEHCGEYTSHEVMQNASLVLTNSHFSLLQPRPLPPYVVEVGGMHIGACKSLPTVSSIAVLVVARLLVHKRAVEGIIASLYPKGVMTLFIGIVTMTI